MRNRLGPHRLFQQLVMMGLLLLPGLCIAGLAQEPVADTERSSSTTIPDWIRRGSYQDGNSYVLVVQTSQHPCTTPVAADQALDPAIEEAIRKHLIPLVGPAANDFVISKDTINTKLLVPGTRIVRKCAEDLSAELAQRYGQEQAVFYRGYAQIRLDQPFINEVTQQSAESRMRYRLLLAGLCGAGMLGLLAVLFGYLRINHATRGFYNRRLQTISIMIMIAIISAIYFAFRSLV